MRIVGVGVVATVALLIAGAVLAANPGKEKIARTVVGNAQAKAEVLRRADLDSGWKGGFRKPDLSSSMPCTNYRPKQSDLVLIGAAESRFVQSLVEVDSESQVLRTAAMVRRDWQRTIVDPRVIPCLRQGLTTTLGPNVKLVSFRTVALPHLVPLIRAFRMVANVKTQVGQVPFEINFVAMGSGGSELSFSIVGPGEARVSLHAMELRLARDLARRVRP